MRLTQMSEIGQPSESQTRLSIATTFPLETKACQTPTHLSTPAARFPSAFLSKALTGMHLLRVLGTMKEK